MELQKNNVKVELVHIGDGGGGEYNPDDTEDERLLRFYVTHKVGDTWKDVDGASYCTTLPISLSDLDQEVFLEMLMEQFYLPVIKGERVKHIGEDMSWVNIEDIHKFSTLLTNI